MHYYSDILYLTITSGIMDLNFKLNEFALNCLVLVTGLSDF